MASYLLIDVCILNPHLPKILCFHKGRSMVGNMCGYISNAYECTSPTFLRWLVLQR